MDLASIVIRLNHVVSNVEKPLLVSSPLRVEGCPDESAFYCEEGHVKQSVIRLIMTKVYICVIQLLNTVIVDAVY